MTSVLSVSRHTLWLTFLAFCCFLCLAAEAPFAAAIAQDYPDEYPDEYREEAQRHLEQDDDHLNLNLNHEHNHNHITKSHNVSIASIALGWIGSLLSLAAGIFVAFFRGRPIVALGQPPFLCLICFGSLLVASVNMFESPEAVLLMEEVTNVAPDDLCIVRMWFFNVGLVVVYMSFVCKLWRAERVCKFRKNRVVHVHHVIGPFCFIVLVQIGILVGQTIVSPPYWSSEIPAYPRDPSRDDVIEKCYQFQLENPTNMAFNAATSGIIILCQVITIWMSYKTRKIREDISDSRRIFQTVVVHIAIAIPAVLMMNGIGMVGPQVYVYQLIYRFLLAVSSLVFLVLPKVHCVYYERKHGRLPSYARTVGGVHIRDNSSTVANSTITTTSRSTNTNTTTTGILRSLHSALKEGRTQPGEAETDITGAERGNKEMIDNIA